MNPDLVKLLTKLLDKGQFITPLEQTLINLIETKLIEESK